MRIARKLALLCIMALAAMALAASTASAAPGPVEVDLESSNAHCTLATCAAEAHGESRLSLFGFTVSTCDDEFVARFNENGTGHITTQTLINHPVDGACTRVACNGVGEALAEREWPITNTAETGPNVGTMNVRFCLDTASSPNNAGVHCTLPVNVAEVSGTHMYQLAADFTCPNGVRVQGDWECEAPHTIEVEHD
jgi:hypothetical protein